MARKKKAAVGAFPDGELLPQGRGRPTELTDDQLHDRRDQLVQAFEGAWGEIGWELQGCQRADDLVGAFNPLAETFVGNLIAVLHRPSKQAASPATLRKLRRDRRTLAAKIRPVETSRYGTQEKLHLADAALAQASGSRYRMIKRQRKKRRKDAARTEQQTRILLRDDLQLASRILLLEASFARTEVSRFVRSRRYAITPLNLANAVAGLPYMGWRQSMKRCVPMKRWAQVQGTEADGLAYQVFKSICYLAASANKKTERTLVKSFRDGIPSLPRRYQLPQAELAQNWFYLERAIRAAYRNKPHPKALPFEIQKRYLKQIQSRSQIDLVLAEGARVRLPKRRSSPVSSEDDQN